MVFLPQSGQTIVFPICDSRGCISVLHTSHTTAICFGWSLINSLGSGWESASQSSYCSSSIADGKLIGFSGGNSGIILRAPQSGHLIFFPALTAAAYIRVPHTRHSRPTSGNFFFAVLGGAAGAATRGGDVPTAGTVNGVSQAAQRARRPAIAADTAKRALHFGHVIT